MRYLYADTSVWNHLCDQNSDSNELSLALENAEVGLAIGFNVPYEIAKLFFTGTKEDKARGRELFAYMKRYFALGVPIIKENWVLLIEEALDVTGQEKMQSSFRDSSQHQLAIQEIEKLCKGEIAPEAARFFEGRKSEARISRTSIRDHLEVRPDLKAILAGITDEALLDFLGTASAGPAGQFLLLGHLLREFSKNSSYELARVAELLLQSPRYRASRVMTRADLYLNWRCVKRGSIRSDLPDDTFHVVSAAYCDVFASTETDQANIARHAIEGVQTIVCNPNELVSEQLLKGVRRTVGVSSSG